MASSIKPYRSKNRTIASEVLVSTLVSATVLTKAVTRAADQLDVTRSQLAAILGLNQPTVSRLYKGEYLLNERCKAWERALLFIRLLRALDAIVSQDQIARQWLRSPNRALNGRPIDLILNTEGLVSVVQYLDANLSHAEGHGWCGCV